MIEFQKDGILGEKYIDEEETEAALNEEGRLGWELATATMVPEGLMLFCKRELKADGELEEIEAAEAEEVSDDSTGLGDIRIF
ncbi:hypothetical protein [Candidatus Electronema sp. PJ]|uniref:hypothetical protein n=1 Tax=Candidatus Electronema sp. PJ TaxID=3401572 RepID=UPI003AA97796